MEGRQERKVEGRKEVASVRDRQKEKRNETRKKGRNGREVKQMKEREDRMNKR